MDATVYYNNEGKCIRLYDDDLYDNYEPDDYYESEDNCADNQEKEHKEAIAFERMCLQDSYYEKYGRSDWGSDGGSVYDEDNGCWMDSRSWERNL